MANRKELIMNYILIKIRVFTVLSMIFILYPSTVLGDTKVVIAEGKYVMGDLDSKSDAKRLALMEAKRLALEKNYELTKDEINSLAAGVLSVEILNEKWEMSGENLMVTITIKAMIDTKGLNERIDSLRSNKESVEEFKNIQAQLNALQKELAEIKEKQAHQISIAEKKYTTEKIKFKEDQKKVIDQMTALEIMGQANLAMLSQEWDNAVKRFELVINKAPRLADAYVGKAAALEKLGRLAEANESIEIALRLRPDSARAHFINGTILFKERRFVSAINQFDQAIRLNPQNPRFFLMRGDANLRLKRYYLALKDFEQACRMGNRIGCNRLEKLRKNLKVKLRQDRRPPRPLNLPPAAR